MIYIWGFRNGATCREIGGPVQVRVGDTIAGIDLALADVGITYCRERRVEKQLQSGELRVVLPDWSPTEPAMYLYYPGHRNPPPGLKELADVLRESMRGDGE